MKCPLCSSESEFFIKAKDSDNFDSFSYNKCINCSLVFLDNPPKDLSSFYPDNYYGEKSKSFSFLNMLLLNLRKNKLKNYSGRLLDIGSGDGSFIDFVKDDFDCYGFEPSAKGFSLSKSKQLEVCNSLNDLPDSFFDIVTMWHSLEHIHNPDTFIVDIKRILKPNGLLLISLPNIDSLMFRIAKSKWFHLDPPRHLIHYSNKTLSSLLKNNSFKIVKQNKFSFEYDPFDFLQSFLNLSNCRFNYLHKKLKHRKTSFSVGTFILSPFLIPLSIPFTLLFSLFNKGSTLTIYSKNEKGIVG